MPDAIPVELHKAVATTLTGATLSQPIEPRRHFGNWANRPVETDESCEVDKLYVDVLLVPTDQLTIAGTRGDLKYTIAIDVVVRKKFGQNGLDNETGRVKEAEVDSLILLVTDIAKLFSLKRMEAFDLANWTGTKILINPHPVHLREYSQFTGVVRITFDSYEEV